MALATLGVTLALAAPPRRPPTTSAPRRATSRRQGIVNLGGFGLGTGALVPDAIVGRGGQGEAKSERIGARAIVFSEGKNGNAIAIADIETQGMFAAYEDGPYGLHDIAQTVEERTGGKLPADHILIASDHTHSGPDTIGAWGGVSEQYLQHIHDQTVDAIVTAFNKRRAANVRAGHSDASDLIYNQSCTEALNQDREPDLPGPRGLRDEGQGRHGARGPGDRRRRTARSSRPTWRSRRTRPPAAATACTATGRSSSPTR